MIPFIRKEKIMDMLKNDEIINIDELQRLIPEVSMSTLRRDLKELEKNEKVILLFGGGIKCKTSNLDLPTSTKLNVKAKEKETIARLASKLINNGDTIYLDSGTTCTVLLNKLYDKKITIITSNTQIFSLPDQFLFNMIFLGGHYNPVISSVSGSLTDENISMFNFDKAFLGANAIDTNLGVSTPSMSEARKKKQVLKRSKKSYLLCDSSKFHKTLMSHAFDINECTIISDKFDRKLAEKTELLVP